MTEQTEKTQVQRLSEKTVCFVQGSGEKVIARLEEESELALHWLHYLNGSQKTGVANELLDGATASVKEAMACAALGLVRPAIFSIRMHIDLIFAWLYFKDHPVEWRNLNISGDGFIMKKEIMKYLSENFEGFGNRLSLLNDVITRKTSDPYRLLSAHVHAQSTVVIPQGNNLEDVVQEELLALECADVWREVSEYVGDILISLYALKWTSIPNYIQVSIESRLKTKRNTMQRFMEGI